MSRSSHSRHTSPRAMPVETIITRFKSAQQKRQLREMDRSMTKVTELLKNPLKPKIKKKESLKKAQSFKRLNNIISLQEEEGQKIKKNKGKNETEIDECCPMKMKRNIVLNKVRLKPNDLKIIAQTNKRKRTSPKKGLFPQESPELIEDRISIDMSPTAKRFKPHQDMSMDEMIQLIEDSGSLNDEDLLEILTCPSPVWWEDPPDGYIEDALFTRPRSTAEMYPSIRSQLQDNLQERQRSSTPNVLSRKERVKKSVEIIEVNDKDENESESNINNDIDVEKALSKCDEKFKKKRSKLESVLGNLRNKTNNNTKVLKPVEVINNNNSDNLSNKVSVIKVCSKEVVNGDNVNESGESNDVKEKDKKDSVSMATDTESTDDEHLTDISFQDDAFLDDLENMDIPMQANNISPKKDKVKTKDESVVLIPNLNKDAQIIPLVTDDKYIKLDCTVTDWSLNECRGVNLKDTVIDPTYRNRKSSIIEDYLELNLFEDDVEEENESKAELKSVPITPPKGGKEQKEKNLKTSVIKFKNSDNTSINVLKIESVVPKILPPLKNSDRIKSASGLMPENLPPLRRNPVINIKTESSKSENSSCTTESSVQDNLDSISDTNICFLNEDDDVICEENKLNNNELGSAVNTVIKSNNIPKNGSTQNKSPENKSSKNFFFPKNEVNFTRDVDLYRNFTQISNSISNELEFQSLTITKVKDKRCCKVENSFDAVIMKKSNIGCEKKKSFKEKECSPPKHNEIGKIETENSECITVYKIVSDDSGNEESKNDISKTKSLKDKDHLKDTTDDCVEEKADGKKDKMVFYFKKCKNLNWKNKNPDKNEDKIAIENKELVKTDIVSNDNNHEVIDNVKNVTVNTGSIEEKKEVKDSEIKKETNHNLTDDTKEQKSIIVPNTNQIRYCMKCSSIFDTEQCNYCHRKNSTDKNKCNRDLLKTHECFICELCKYKAITKDNLETHMSCCESNHR